jgi:hypothetical protein
MGQWRRALQLIAGVVEVAKAAAAVAIAAEALVGPWAGVETEAEAAEWSGEAPGTGAERWTAVQVHR